MPLLELTKRIINTPYNFMEGTLTTSPNDTDIRMSIVMRRSSRTQRRGLTAALYLLRLVRATV